MQTIKERFKNIKRIGLKKSLYQDLYHKVLTTKWSIFFSFYAVFFIAFNAFFGFLFWLQPESVTGTNGEYFKYFSFSVQTFSTIGYGIFAPATNYAHFLVITESIFSVLITALLTGLFFAKFSRPTARFKFTNKIIITKHNGVNTMMFRVANERGNQIAETTIKAVVLKSELSAEGNHMRVQKDVPFIRNTSSFFIFSWSVMHVINEDSPYYNMTAEDLKNQGIEMSVSIIGHDETFSQTVHASCIYSPEDFVFNKKFADIINTEGNLTRSIDYTKFDVIVDI